MRADPFFDPFLTPFPTETDMETYTVPGASNYAESDAINSLKGNVGARFYTWKSGTDSYMINTIVPADNPGAGGGGYGAGASILSGYISSIYTYKANQGW